MEILKLHLVILFTRISVVTEPEMCASLVLYIVQSTSICNSFQLSNRKHFQKWLFTFVITVIFSLHSILREEMVGLLYMCPYISPDLHFYNLLYQILHQQNEKLLHVLWMTTMLLCTCIVTHHQEHSCLLSYYFPFWT